MKKLLAFLLTVVLVTTASVCVAFATPSAEAQGIISGISAIDADKSNASLSVEKIDGKVNKYFYETLADLKDEKNDKTFKVVGHYDLAVEGEPEYPLTVTLDVLGISESSKVYVLVQKGEDVVTITPKVLDGKVVFELEEEIEKLAVVTDGKTATKVEKENDVLSPQTRDITLYVALIALVAMVALVIVPKKVKL